MLKDLRDIQKTVSAQVFGLEIQKWAASVGIDPRLLSAEYLGLDHLSYLLLKLDELDRLTEVCSCLSEMAETLGNFCTRAC